MTTSARAGGGVEVEASTGEPEGGRARRVLLRLLLVLVACGAAGAAGWFLGGDWIWGGFAAGLMLTAIVVLRGAWQPAGGGNVEVQAAGRDAWKNDNRKFTLNAGGFSAVAGAALILAVNGLLVTHVSTGVPGGRYYQPSTPEPGPEETAQPATAVASVLLRDLPEEQISRTSGSAITEAGVRIAGRHCARSLSQRVFEIGLPHVITLTPNTRYKRFTALAGMPDEEDPKASTEFALLGDGQRLIDQKTASPGKPAEFDQDISAYTTLYLRATLITSKNGTDPGGDYRAVWGDAQLLPANGQPNVCPTSAGN